MKNGFYSTPHRLVSTTWSVHGGGKCRGNGNIILSWEYKGMGMGIKYENRSREEWVLLHASQVCTAVSFRGLYYSYYN